MLLRKRDLHQFVPFLDPDAIPGEVSGKLDLLADLFERSRTAAQEA